MGASDIRFPVGADHDDVPKRIRCCSQDRSIAPGFSKSATSTDFMMKTSSCCERKNEPIPPDCLFQTASCFSSV